MKNDPEIAHAMRTAIEKNDLFRLKKLLEDKNQKNPIIEEIMTTDGTVQLTVLHSIAFYGNFDMFKHISATMKNLHPKTISKYYDIGIRPIYTIGSDATPLHFAAASGNLPLVKFLTNCMLEINPTAHDGWTVRDYAVEWTRFKIIDFYDSKLKDIRNKN